jgi:transposase, IS30 family
MTKYRQLAQEERYLIAAHLSAGQNLTWIACELGRSKGTISRELQRNATRHDGAYRPEKAHSYATARRRRTRRGRRFSDQDMGRVERWLKRRWSPEQISCVLGRRGELQISHESIYEHIRRDKRLGGNLFRHTRIMSKFGRKRYRSKDSRGVLPGKRHISERPAEAEQRLRIGHWEGDTVIGSDKRHCILTLVERKTGYAVIKKLAARNMEEVTRAATRAIAMHQDKIETITFDNGTEFHDYAVLEQRFPIKCYFATPYHSWERGSNENFNGLVRQYLPKGSCMRHVTQADCDRIANELNERPRKRHDFRSPGELYAAS